MHELALIAMWEGIKRHQYQYKMSDYMAVYNNLPYHINYSAQHVTPLALHLLLSLMTFEKGNWYSVCDCPQLNVPGRFKYYNG